MSRVDSAEDADDGGVSSLSAARHGTADGDARKTTNVASLAPAIAAVTTDTAALHPAIATITTDIAASLPAIAAITTDIAASLPAIAAITTDIASLHPAIAPITASKMDRGLPWHRLLRGFDANRSAGFAAAQVPRGFARCVGAALHGSSGHGWRGYRPFISFFTSG